MLPTKERVMRSLGNSMSADRIRVYSPLSHIATYTHSMMMMYIRNEVQFFYYIT